MPCGTHIFARALQPTPRRPAACNDAAQALVAVRTRGTCGRTDYHVSVLPRGTQKASSVAVQEQSPWPVPRPQHIHALND
eukprot:2178392-Rhodomonas_salina.1